MRLIRVLLMLADWFSEGWGQNADVKSVVRPQQKLPRVSNKQLVVAAATRYSLLMMESCLKSKMVGFLSEEEEVQIIILAQLVRKHPVNTSRVSPTEAQTLERLQLSPRCWQFVHFHYIKVWELCNTYSRRQNVHFSGQQVKNFMFKQEKLNKISDFSQKFPPNKLFSMLHSCYNYCHAALTCLHQGTVLLFNYIFFLTVCSMSQ